MGNELRGEKWIINHLLEVLLPPRKKGGDRSKCGKGKERPLKRSSFEKGRESLESHTPDIPKEQSKN